MVAIEVIVGIGILLVLLLWALWYRITTWGLKRKYNKLLKKEKIKTKDNFYNGTTKKGEVKRRTEIAGRKSEIPGSVGGFSRPPQFTARELFQTATLAADGKADSSNGKTGNSNGKTRRTSRNPFIKRR